MFLTVISMTLSSLLALVEFFFFFFLPAMPHAQYSLEYFYLSVLHHNLLQSLVPSVCVCVCFNHD